MDRAGCFSKEVGCLNQVAGRHCPISKAECRGEGCSFAEILDNISLGILGLDTRTREVFFVNRMVESILCDTPCRDYFAVTGLLCPDSAEVSSGGEAREPRSLRYRDRFLGYTIYRIGTAYLWIFLSDITEKTRLNAIAEAVNAMNNLGFVFSGIRHELGNPVNSIKTTLTVFRNNLASFSQDSARGYLERIQADLIRVESLLKDLRNFSMYENPSPREVHLPTFLANLRAMVEEDLSRRGIRLRMALAPGVELGFFDPRALQHVLLNLLTNAADALVGREAPEICVSLRAEGDMRVLEVHDNGRGIPESVRPHLFQPFATSKSHGTGLGLVIVKKMMLLMRGTVEIVSREGEGTTVRLSMQAKP